MAKTGPSCSSTWRDLLRENAEIGEIVNRGVTCSPSKAGEIHFRRRNRMAAIGLIGFVLRNQMNEVLRRHRGDRDQAAKIHQERAVALQDDDALVRPAQRQTEPVRGVEAHRADRRIVEDAGSDFDPIHRRAIGGDHRLIGDVASQNPETFVALHHVGLRPIRNATGANSA